MKLLTVANAKTPKGEARGYLTGILYLAPGKLSGFQVCPKASPGCLSACLYTAGRGGMQSTQRARMRKTRWFFEDRAGFMAQLYADILNLTLDATRAGMLPAVRLNGTSDIPWESIPLDAPNGARHASIMAAFPAVQFYDYTKRPGRVPPQNYHLTFSLSETNDLEASAEVGRGINVAAVFREIPSEYLGLPTVSGDEDDLRFLDPPGVIVALRAKGKAKQDRSGFVR